MYRGLELAWVWEKKQRVGLKLQDVAPCGCLGRLYHPFLPCARKGWRVWVDQLILWFPGTWGDRAVSLSRILSPWLPLGSRLGLALWLMKDLAGLLSWKPLSESLSFLALIIVSSASYQS